MAAADPPAGLMDVASTLSQDNIPFKLRCAICNKLATNAFRLPCCDQSICETCQASLSDTCPVCAHTPVSPDLCKPNKALRTTLKAFLRTEEKKREKDRQSAAPPTPTANEPGPAELSTEKDASEAKPTVTPEGRPGVHLPSETKSHEAATEAPPADTAANGTRESAVPERAETETEAGLVGDKAPEAPSAEADTKPTDGDASVDDQSQGPSQQNVPSMVNMGPGSLPGMNWNGNANLKGMNPFMANPMFTFPNPMGMSVMNMDPMAANQGMFGDYGMNMTGMGMNMGMNFNGQGMYGSLGWDGSQQHMWHGGQDNFNPNAFANGTGPPYGGAFGGSNMSYPSNSGFQSGYYGPGYGRGGFRGGGRGGFQGPGRGGFAGHPTKPAFSHQHLPEEGSKAAPVDSEGIPQASEPDAGQQASETTTADVTAETIPAEAGSDGQQLHGIPTVDSQNQPFSMGPNGYQGHMGPGYERDAFMRGPAGRGCFWGGPYQPPIEQPKGPGVEGAPAAPRAMRQGLPNTSVLRHRGFHVQGRGSVGSNTPARSQRDNSEPPQDSGRARSPSKAPSQPPAGDSRSHSLPRSPASRHRSPTLQVDEDRDGRRGGEIQRTEDDYDNYVRDRRSRSPSRMSSSRASRRRHRDNDRDRIYRSHRSRRHRSRSYSRSRSPTRNGDARPSERLPLITEESELNSHKEASKTGYSKDRISSHRSGRDRSSRREEERDRNRARKSQHQDRDRERHRHRRDRDRDSERERRRDRERERDRGHGRTDRDRKRSRRDRSESAASRDDSTRPQARRVKRDAGDDQDRDRDGQTASAASKPEPEKDPYTLEREARNRERMLREQQNREGTKSSQSKSSHRRNGRQDRLVGGRRINYKYEDEL